MNRWFLLIESNQISDERINDDTRFLAGTKENVLYLIDISNDNKTYNSFYDILVIVDKDKKQLEYPKHYIGSYQYEDKDEVYNIKNQHIKKIYNDLLKFGIVEAGYSLKNFQSSYLTNINALPNDENITLYHGTTMKSVDNIKRFGLKPIDTLTLANTITSRNRGNRSTIPNHTDKNVYLTPNRVLAIQYAKSQAKYRNDIPILCTVHVPDTSKLILDDDYIKDVIYKKLNVFMRVKSESEIEFYSYISGDEIVSNVFNDEEHMLEVADDENKLEFTKELIEFIKLEYKKLINSHHTKSIISKYNAVAYKGRIPAKFITIKELPPLTENVNKFARLREIFKQV